MIGQLVADGFFNSKIGGVAMKRWFGRLAAEVAAPLKRILGMGLWQIFNWVYDNPIWIAAQIKFGFWGVVAASIGAITINLCALLYYRRKNVSWLLWDTGSREIKKNFWRTYFRACALIVVVLYDGSGLVFLILTFLTAIFLFVGKVVLRSRVLENVFMFFVLSFYQDSFIATAYLRHGRCDGLKKRDALVFSASSIVSVFYWAVRNGLIAEFIIRPMVGH